MTALPDDGSARFGLGCYDPSLLWFWDGQSMHIAAVGWLYVTLMMAITEESVVAGIMTFFLYGVLPTLIILYIGGSGQRRRRRALETQQRLADMQAKQSPAPAATTSATSDRANPDQ